MNKSIYFLVSIFLLVLCFKPYTAEGKEIVLGKQNGELVILNTPLIVNTEDVLKIPEGANIRIENQGYIYSKGSIFIGVDRANAMDDINQSTTSSSSIPVTQIGTEDYLIKKIKITSYTDQFFIQSDGGQVIILNTDFTGSRFISAYRQTEVSIVLSSFTDLNPNTNKTGNSSFISIYSQSNLDISYSTIQSVSSVNQSKKPTLIEMYNESKGEFTEVNIRSENSNSVISVFNNSDITFSKSNINSCDTWLTVYSTSKVMGTLNKPTCRDDAVAIYGNSVSTLVFEENRCCSSVLFIPGIEGSRLYKKQIFENQLWEPNRNLDVEKLFMDSAGRSIVSGIYTRDIIEKINILGPIPLKSIYSGFVLFLKDLKQKKLLKDYYLFSYDWRYRPEDIITDDVILKIENLALNSINGKVSIVAHSYGGIVSKELLLKLKEKHKEYLIDKVVLVAVPETGAPSALFAHLNGEGQSILGGILLSSATMMNFAKNLPSIYILMPSLSYARTIGLFLHITGSSIEDGFNISLPAKPGSIINWMLSKLNQTSETLSLDPTSTPLAATSNILLENQANQKQISYGLSKNILESSYKIWSIAGVGLDTLSGMKYEYNNCQNVLCIGKPKLSSFPQYSLDGDGSVVLDAARNRIGNLIKIQLADLNMARKVNIRHANMLESADVQSAIKQILVLGKTVMDGSFLYLPIDPLVYSGEMVQYHIVGDVTGGLVKSGSNNEIYKTGLYKDENLQYILEQIPNSSAYLMGNNLTLNASVESMQNTKVQFESSVNQIINISNDVLVQHTPDDILISTGTAFGEGSYPTYTSSTIIFENVIVGVGSLVTITGSSTVLVDIDRDGDDDREYTPAYPQENQSTSTASTSNQTELKLLSDLKKLTEKVIKNRDDITSNVILFAVRKSFKSKYDSGLLALNKIILRIESEIQKQNSSSVSNTTNQIKLNKAEIKEINKLLSKTQSDIKRLASYEALYKKQVVSVNTLIYKLGLSLIPAKNLAKKVNAEANLKDIGWLYVLDQEFKVEVLEFIRNHGNI